MFSQLKRLNFRLNYGLLKSLKHPQITVIASNVHYVVPKDSCTFLLPQLPVVRLQKMYSQATVKIANFDNIQAVKENSTLLIDVREPSELQETGVLPSSINIPLNDLENILKNTDGKEFLSKYGKNKPTSNTPIIFSCRSGVRSAKAANIAINLGFINVSNFEGGWLEWEEKTKL